MRLYSRYLSKAYIKVFLICTFGFISILLITRLKDIAKFASLTPNIFKVMQYTFFQIPFILPFAISVSCLISSFLLMSKLSKNFELTAFRASGISLKKIIYPVVTLSLFISLLSFIIISEISPYCRIKSKKIAHMEMTQNPIVLLERHQLLKLHNLYVDLETNEKMTSANNFMLIAPNKGNNRLNLITANNINVDGELLYGKNISIISYFNQHAEEKGEFDTLIIENQEDMITDSSNLSKYLKSKSFSINPIHFPTKLLFIRQKDLAKTKMISAPLLEIIKRAAISLSAFTFTFIGICFGMEINRTFSKKKLFYAFISALVILLSFTIGKGFKSSPLLAIFFYMIPQPLIILFSYLTLRKISKGRL